MPIKRTTLLLDTDLMEQAAKALGTSKPTETVRASLRQAARRGHLRNLVAWELPDSASEELARQRAPRR